MEENYDKPWTGKTKKQEAYIAYGGDKEMLKLYEEAKSTLLR